MVCLTEFAALPWHRMAVTPSLAWGLGARALVLLLPAALAGACGGSETADGGGGTGGAGACTTVVLDGKGGILPHPDGAAACPAGACNYQTQAGCSDDQACRPYYPAGATTVIPRCEAVGTGRSGDACKASTECARGYMCLADEAGGMSCHKQCCGGDWSACDPGESCIRQFFVQFADGHKEQAGDFCVPVNNCDPLDPKSCDSVPGRECKIADPTGAVACSPKSAAKLGDSCAPPNVCAQGLTCVGRASTGYFCRQLCRAEACGKPDCSVAGGDCVHFDRDPAGVGECTLR